MHEHNMSLPAFAVPLLIGCVIQVIKLVIDMYVKKRITRKQLRSAGGFPSVHSGISASITTLMALSYGIDSYAFALASTFSFLFRYDAANVRYEAGQHAFMLNRIGQELRTVLHTEHIPEQFPSLTTQLKERLGHTFIEVVGGVIIGIALTLAYWFI